MKKHIIILALLGLLPAAFAATPSIEGHYTCHGKELGTQESYKCSSQITKTGATYKVHCECDKDVYDGTGIFDAESKSLSFAFINPAKAEESGVTVVHMRGANKLESFWTYMNKDTIAVSYCERIGTE